MGSPLASALANIFMGFYEYDLNKPKFYLRYVDDILAAFDKEQNSLINHSITFLDVFISGMDNQNLTLQTYHKSTYTGLLLNFKSFTSFSY